jgi:hypothetical protein
MVDMTSWGMHIDFGENTPDCVTFELTHEILIIAEIYVPAGVNKWAMETRI